jgi:hypothetical protein
MTVHARYMWAVGLLTNYGTGSLRQYTTSMPVHTYRRYEWLVGLEVVLHTYE